MIDPQQRQQRLAAWRQEENQPFSGWDFARLEGRWRNETPPWSYEALVRELMAGSAAVLDLGTGGGERLSEFRDVFPARVAATEGYPPNLKLAQARLEPLGVTVRGAEASLASTIPFDDASFDLVIDRHTSFNSAEVERVLKPGGVFLTQQVDGNNLSDLSAVFNYQQPWTYFSLDFALDLIRQANLVLELAQEWPGKTYFQDVGAIVYYLKAVPWTVEGFSVEKHWPQLEQLQARLERTGELWFTQKLMIVRARKPV